MSALKLNCALPYAARHGETFGTPELCTWPMGGGVCRFQTRRPDFARKLSQRSGARLVAWSVHNGYLRIFEERIEPWRARDLVTRFLTATNGALFDSKRSPARRKSLGSMSTAARSNRRGKAASVPGVVP